MKFASKIYKLEHLHTHYVEIPSNVVQKLGGKFNVRLLCTLNYSIKFQCGIVALGEGKGYISLNAQRLKELKRKPGDDVKVELVKDTTEYGLDLPEELQEVLAQDKEGQKRFNQLVPGKQRFIIRHVTAVKNSQLRIDRALFMIENLKQLARGKETFKALLGKE